jgi:phosphatidate cytidylyltransferase
VRILGAEEAQAALDLTAAERADRQSRTIPYPDEGPSWTARMSDETEDAESEEAGTGADLDPADEAPSAELPPLPHWTEPPTGAVPAIFADDDGDDVADDLDAWAAVVGDQQPRFRAEGSDWADADFSEELSGEHERLGALSEEGPADEEAEFAEALAERRRPPRARGQAAAATAANAAVADAAADEPATPITPRPPRPQRPRPSEPELSPQGPTRSRDLPTALMTAATMVIVAFVCFFEGPTWTTALAAAIIAIASLELCNSLRAKGMRPVTLVTLIASGTLPIAAYNVGSGAYPLYFALVVVVSMLWFLWQVTPGRPLLGVATTVLAFAYVGGLGGFAGLLLAQNDGVGLILGVAICTISYDVVGFFVGSQFGRTRIAPRISPNKSLQGTVAGMAASVVLGALIAGQIAPWSTGKGFVLGVVVAIGAFLGDLSASMIKRDIGLKDFGALLPGHGGVLDRFDSLLFCLPIAYYLAVALDIFPI